MEKDALQSAGESSHFGRLNAFESSPRGGCYDFLLKNLDKKMQQMLSFFYF